MSNLLDITDFTLTIPGRRPLLRDISLSVAAGESVALVGESGSGKSLTTRAALGLFPNAAELSGSVRVGGIDTVTATPGDLRTLRTSVAAMIFQDPRAGINPVRTIGDFLTEAIRRRPGVSRDEANARALDQLGRVGLSDAPEMLTRFPHQLSGGMLQRVMIAAALLQEPELLLCDEPTTALDVTTQAGILDLLRDAQRDRGMGMLFITHDLALASSLCERVIVLRTGEIVEAGPTERVFFAPEAAYTRMLLAATPKLTATAPPAPDAEAPVLLDVSAARKVYTRPGKPDVVALDGVSLSLPRGGSVGIVGESGSGKSTLARLIVGLEGATEGAVRIGDAVLPDRPLTARERRRSRIGVQIVFQDPYLSLDPRIPVGRAVADVFRLRGGVARNTADTSAAAILARVGLAGDTPERRPRDLSGGQRQRVAMAKALAASPDLLVLDEATSALDVSVQAQVLDLVAEIREQLGLTLVFVSHDLAVVSAVCEHTVVMQNGRIVEQGPTTRILRDPREAYTQSLLDARPTAAWRDSDVGNDVTTPERN